MELMSLLAKLTLDAKQFNDTLEDAQDSADSFSMPDDPELDLNSTPFNDTLDEAHDSAESFKMPDDPELDLDAEPFSDALDAAEDEADGFEGPDDQVLDLETGNYTDGLKKAEDKSSAFSDSVGSIFKELKGVLVTAGIAAVVTGIVNSLKEGVNLARQHGDMIDKQSQKMNISAKAYQEWSYALDLSGASIDDLNRGLRTWQQAVGDEDQTAKLGEAFGKLGIDAEKAFSQIEKGENLDALLAQTMEALSDYQGGDRGAIAEVLFGRGANGLNALFNMTADEIRDIRKEAEDLGLIMSDEEVKNAAAYNDAVTRLEGAINGIKEAFVADLMPLLTNAANTVAKIVAFFNPRTSKNSFSDSLKETNKDLAKETASIEGTADAAMEMVDKLLKMGDAEKLTAEQQKEWQQTAEWLIANIPSLSSVIDLDTQKINGNKDAIAANIKEWEKLEKTRAVAAAKEAKYNEFMEKNAEAIDKQATARAAQNDAVLKEKEAISMANQLLSQNSELARQFGGDSIDRNGNIVDQLDSVEAILTGLNYDQYELMHGANSALYTAEVNAQRAQEEYEKVSDALNTAKEQYDQWVQAIDEIYGSASDSAGEATSDVEKLESAINKLPSYKQIQIDALFNDQLFPHAKGNWNVPYDNYPALLHRGERVLTKSQARQSDDGGGSGAIVNAIQGLRNDMANLKLVVGRKTFGKAVVDYGGSGVNSYIGGSESRLAAGYGT